MTRFQTPRKDIGNKYAIESEQVAYRRKSPAGFVCTKDKNYFDGLLIIAEVSGYAGKCHHVDMADNPLDEGDAEFVP